MESKKIVFFEGKYYLVKYSKTGRIILTPVTNAGELQQKNVDYLDAIIDKVLNEK